MKPEKCFLFDGCKVRAAYCNAMGPTEEWCPVYRYFRDMFVKKQAVEIPGWISVKDRLPEYTGWYLTYHHKINLCVVSWFTGDGWEDGDWGAYEDGWVSHWMPLPEDPKEVSGDGTTD